jgi:glycosyltransferase involved in cell wall biosynthesis
MKISVVIPTYNRLPLLREALESIALQTYDNYEIIVVNDFPSQAEDISLLCSQFDKVHVINQPVSKGGNAARNAGITHAKGDIIAFLDDDDTWSAEKLYKHAKMHTLNPAAGLVYSNCTYFWENGVLNDEVFPTSLPNDIIKEMCKGRFCPATTTAVTVRKECFEKSGLFDESLVSFQDWDMWFRIAHNYSFVLIDEPLVRFRQHFGSRVSYDIDKRLSGLKQISTKWAEYLGSTDFYKKQRQNTYYKYTRQLILSGKKKAAFTASFRMLFLNDVMRSIKLFLKLQVMILTKPKLLRTASVLAGR